MSFWFGNHHITNARNIEWKDNGDGTSQLWFTSLFVDKDGNKRDLRYHVPKMRADPGLFSMESVNGVLYEVTEIDDEF